MVCLNQYGMVIHHCHMILKKGDLPDVVVHPGNAQEIARMVSYANEHKIPVATYDSNSSLIFSTKPKHHGITVSAEDSINYFV
jgi:FAD/FMN-containing dehydrogenase